MQILVMKIDIVPRYSLLLGSFKMCKFFLSELVNHCLEQRQ